jgi:hypothetical protein
LRSSTLDSLHNGVSPGSIGCSTPIVALLEKRRFLYNHSGDFPQVILILSQSRAEQFGYIVRLSQWGGGGYFIRSNDTLFAELRGSGGRGAIYSAVQLYDVLSTPHPKLSHGSPSIKQRTPNLPILSRHPNLAMANPCLATLQPT